MAPKNLPVKHTCEVVILISFVLAVFAISSSSSPLSRYSGGIVIVETVQRKRDVVKMRRRGSGRGGWRDGIGSRYVRVSGWGARGWGGAGKGGHAEQPQWQGGCSMMGEHE